MSASVNASSWIVNGNSRRYDPRERGWYRQAAQAGALGYVAVVAVAFLLGLAVTALCATLRRRGGGKDGSQMFPGGTDQPVRLNCRGGVGGRIEIIIRQSGADRFRCAGKRPCRGGIVKIDHGTPFFRPDHFRL